MVAKTPDEHFAEYTRNNAVKHRIFSDYFHAYLLALGNQVKAFHYIDGFAGRGRYGEAGVGSPLLALEQLGKQRLPFSISLVEASAPDFQLLQQAFAETNLPGNLRDPPLFANGSFSDQIDAILMRSIYQDFSPTATFALADPCGISGLRVADVAKIIRRPFGECLLFWNYDGFNRVVGSVAKNKQSPRVLVELLGDDTFVTRAIELYRTVGNTGQKVHFMCELLADALRAHTGATHVLPFRFQSEGSARTSHYLIHCSTSGLAFKIMKDVMHVVSASEAPDLFEFSQASEDRGQFALLQPLNEGAAIREIETRLSQGPCKVYEITKKWPERQTDFLTERMYRRILLELEKQGLLVVLDKSCERPLPPDRRQRRGGAPTLSPDLFIASPGS
jgi:three-Cys-motif partner protein